MGLTLGLVRSLEKKEQAELIKLDVSDFCPIQSVYVFRTKENRGTAAFCSFFCTASEIFVIHIKFLILIDKKCISLFQRILAIFFMFCTAAVYHHFGAKFEVYTK